MLSLSVFEVRIEMRDGGQIFSQLFVGKPTAEEVIEVIESRPHASPYWAELLEQHGMPRFFWKDSTREEELEFWEVMDVHIATVRVIPQKPIPVSASSFPEVYSDEYLKRVRSHYA